VPHLPPGIATNALMLAQTARKVSLVLSIF